MADDEESKPHHATARPPPGEEDVYSASTVVGEASDEILAIIRGEKAPAAPAVPTELKAEPNSDKKNDAKAEIKTPLAMPVPRPGAGVPAPSGSEAKPAYKATPLEVPLTKLEATSVPPASVEIAPDPEPEPIVAKPPPPPPPAQAAPDAPDLPNAPAVADAPPAGDPIAAAPMAPSAIDERKLEKGTVPPALGIVLFFLAVVLVLVALIR